MKHTFTLLTALLLAPLAALRADELKVASVFTSNTVLQRDKPVPVWGWAEPNARVTVEFAGQNKDATAEAGGKWSVTLDALPANAAPALLTISAPPAKPLSIASFVVGDVFFSAGGGDLQ